MISQVELQRVGNSSQSQCLIETAPGQLLAAETRSLAPTPDSYPRSDPTFPLINRPALAREG